MAEFPIHDEQVAEHYEPDSGRDIEILRHPPAVNGRKEQLQYLSLPDPYPPRVLLAIVLESVPCVLTWISRITVPQFFQPSRYSLIGIVLYILDQCSSP